jgi:hypothetical protein
MISGIVLGKDRLFLGSLLDWRMGTRCTGGPNYLDAQDVESRLG